MAKSEEELKSLLMKVKEESENVGLKSTLKKENQDHSVWSQHFMANRRRKSGSSGRFYFLGLQKSLWMVTAIRKLQDTSSLEGKL